MIEIGQTYLDIWGVKHKIQGWVTLGFHHLKQTKSDDLVYSNTTHFHLNGWVRDSRNGGHHLIDDLVMSPNEAIATWTDRIKLIESNNPTDKLVLVQGGLDNMRERIKFHQGRQTE